MALADQENFTVSNHLLSPEESPPTTRTTTTVTDTKNKDNSKQSTVRFWPQIYVPILVLLYTAILLTAWSIFCVLSRGSMASIPNVLNHYKYSPDVEAALKAHERWYRAARVLWGIIGVSTIPVASSVCGFAAVGFVQSQRNRKASFTLRQTLGIANRGWTSPDIILSLLWRPGLYSTSFLWLASILHILGAVINSLHGLLVGQIINKVPLHDDYILTSTTDILAITSNHILNTYDQGDIIAMLRPSPSTARPSDVYSNLWKGNASCLCEKKKCYKYDDSVFACQRAVVNTADQEFEPNDRIDSPTLDLFVSSLGSDTNTGMIRQYAPRINSSIVWDDLEQGEFPRDCLGDSFFQNYTVGTDLVTDMLSASVSSCLATLVTRHLHIHVLGKILTRRFSSQPPLARAR